MVKEWESETMEGVTLWAGYHCGYLGLCPAGDSDKLCRTYFGIFYLRGGKADYLFTSSLSSLSEDHSWSFTSQRLTTLVFREHPQAERYRKSETVSAGHLRGEWGVLNDHYKGRALCAVPMHIQVISRNSALLPTSHSFMGPGRTEHNFRAYVRASGYTCF